MSSYMADLMATRPAASTTRGCRINIRTSKRALPRDIHQLQRAFDRTVTKRGEGVTAAQVSADRGCFLVAIETPASGRHAIAQCEALFAEAWYDAFGQRSCPHVWWANDDPRPAPEPHDEGMVTSLVPISGPNPSRAAGVREPVFSLLDAAQALSDDHSPLLAPEREELAADVDALRACADVIESILARTQTVTL